MDKTRITVEIGGQEFRISGNESEGYIRRLAAVVNRRIADVQSQYPQLSSTKCVLLAMLNLEDEMQKLRAEYDALDQKISQLREMPRVAAPVKRPFERERTGAGKKPVGV